MYVQYSSIEGAHYSMVVSGGWPGWLDLPGLHYTHNNVGVFIGSAMFVFIL